MSRPCKLRLSERRLSRSRLFPVVLPTLLLALVSACSVSGSIGLDIRLFAVRRKLCSADYAARRCVVTCGSQSGRVEREAV